MTTEHQTETEATGTLVLRGTSHVLRAIPVKGETWVGMIHVRSLSDAAMLTPADARALRDWLDAMLAEHPQPCPCGHSAGMHNDGECMACETCPPVSSSPGLVPPSSP